MLKPRFHTVLNAQRRSPIFLSMVSYTDLSTERPNPEHDQDRAQRRSDVDASNVSVESSTLLSTIVCKMVSM